MTLVAVAISAQLELQKQQIFALELLFNSELVNWRCFIYFCIRCTTFIDNINN